MDTAKTTATRARLLETALALFESRGFTATTVDDIANEAGVSHMTFFRYFPTKESVILDDPFDPLIAASVAAQPADLRPLDRVAHGLREALRHIDAGVDTEVRRRIAIAATEPSLRAGMHQNTIATEDAIALALHEVGADVFEARIAASSCLAAITTSLLWWATHGDDRTLGECVREALDVAAPISPHATSAIEVDQ